MLYIMYKTEFKSEHAMRVVELTKTDCYGKNSGLIQVYTTFKKFYH